MSERRNGRALSTESRDRIGELLVILAEHDRAIEAKAYARFLADEAVATLFGPSTMNRRQMFDDTLIAIHDLADDASWLRENLLTLGSRHRHTYEVATRTYDAWRDAVIEGTRDVVAARLTDELARALEEALDLVHELMLEGAHPRESNR